MSNSYGSSVSLAIRSLRIRYLLLLDLLLIFVAVLLAIFLRLENLPEAWSYLQAGGWSLLLVAPAIRLPLYTFHNLYNRLWRYASTEELHGIMRVGLLAPVIIAFINFVLLPAFYLPSSSSRSVWLLEAILSLFMLAGLRFILRFLQQRRRRVPATDATPNLPTIIVGAGDTAAMILREIKHNHGLGMTIIGLVDDDKAKHHNTLSGVPVLGGCERIPSLVEAHQIRQIIIAMPTAPGKVIRKVVQMCEGVGIRPRIVPRLDTLVHNSQLLSQLRPVELEDLLRREPIVTDIAAVQALLSGKRVLVTGGGGSIGSELCRQILRCHPAELIIVGHGENSIFEIEQELRQIQKHEKNPSLLTTYIADIRMAERILTIFQLCQPEIVFHAAAHKHVPLMEENPSEAISNNILGTRNLLLAAQAVDAKRFIMVSTDKAVNPTNVMGASKRAAELLVLDTAHRTGKAYAAVRFGNVLGSRGSVVLTFKRQIAKGGPITVTHPEVRRFFMTIPEAVQLLLQAAVLGHGGEIFMLDMGELVRIVDLATDLVQLSGLEVGRDIDITYTGLRPGEKLFEELFLPGETYHTTAHAKIRIASEAGQFVPSHLQDMLHKLEAAVGDTDAENLRHLLQNLVPEYQIPDDSIDNPDFMPSASIGYKNSEISSGIHSLNKRAILGSAD